MPTNLYYIIHFQERGGNYAKIADAYYGLVIENFECEQSIYTAVEVTAGNRLFHHIVESDKVQFATIQHSDYILSRFSRF